MQMAEKSFIHAVQHERIAPVPSLVTREAASPLGCEFEVPLRSTQYGVAYVTSENHGIPGQYKIPPPKKDQSDANRV